MKFILLESELKFFKEMGFIEFDNIFSETLIDDLENTIDSLLSSKPLPSKDDTKPLRDLFRRSDFIKKTLLNKNFKNIIKILTKKERLRLVFDLAIVDTIEYPFEKETPLDNLFSFQGLILGVLIKLDSKKNSEINYLPKKRGNATFFKSSLPINLAQIYHLKKQKYLLIGFGEAKTIYKLNTNDAQVNYLKELGYSFGDVLKDKFHPLIF
ncbi:MAG: hypothetical protein K940chlam1_00436 [Candidatus Anoxychlamydiales bacterium]|nr:hypothetical protein [Candidatus Anoxychlamydiales bacterium]